MFVYIILSLEDMEYAFKGIGAHAIQRVVFGQNICILRGVYMQNFDIYI